MLPIQRIRDDPEAVRDGVRRKGESAPIDELLAVDAEARSLRTTVEQDRAEQRRRPRRCAGNRRTSSA